MPMHPPGDEERRLIKLLHALVRQRMSLEEAAALFGLPNEKALKNRFYLDARLTFTEMLKFADKLGIDRQELFAGVRILPPSLLNLPAVLRYFAGRDALEDEELRRYLDDPPGPVLAEGEDTRVAVGVPQRFLELEDLRARDPRSLPRILDEWLKEAHAKAVFDPTPAKVIEYCSALDLKATEISGRGQRIDAALLVAHALELCPPESLFTGYLRDHAAAALRRIGPLSVALALACQAAGESLALANSELEARCLLTQAAAYVELGTEEGNAKAENAYRRVVAISPTGIYALTAAVAWSFILVERGLVAQALEFSDSIEEEVGLAAPSIEFHRLWIRGRAHVELDRYTEAIESFESALRMEPEARDSVNLLLVLDGLRRVPTCSFDRVAEWARRLTPCLRRIDVEAPAAAGIAKRVVAGLVEKKASQQKLDAWMKEFRVRLARSQP